MAKLSSRQASHSRPPGAVDIARWSAPFDPGTVRTVPVPSRQSAKPCLLSSPRVGEVDAAVGPRHHRHALVVAGHAARCLHDGSERRVELAHEGALGAGTLPLEYHAAYTAPVPSVASVMS